MKRFSLAIATLVLCAAVGYSQTALATVTGTVTDSTGAVIANVPITLRNLDNGQVYSGASSATGNFTVTQLPIGDYDLTVTSTGFKTYSHSRFHLAANQIMREDIALQIGQAAESVTVTAEATLLKTENSEVTQNVTLSQLNNLPILIVGATGEGIRDPFQAVRLVPGVRYAAGANIGAGGAPAVVTTMVINGTPANSYGTRLDGMTMNPTSPRLLGAQMQTQPSVDALQEVAIETSNFAAEYGAAGGAMVNMVTKSGTNQYHGGAYDYGTNEALNAHQPYLGTRNKIRQHDWGFTIGGPVRIPKVYNGTNRTFFFWSYEEFDQKALVITSNSVPTAAYRGGDFSNLITAENKLITTTAGNFLDPLNRTIASGTIFDPTTQNTANGKAYRDPFPGNKIPQTAAYLDPISQKVLALIPAPQGPNFDKGQVSNNFTGPYDTSRRSKIPSIKVDQSIGSKGHMSFYFQRTDTHTPRTTAGADAFPDLITTGAISRSNGRTIRLNYDHTLTPRLLLHVGAGWNDSDFGLEAPVSNYDAFTSLGLKGQNEPLYFPRLTFAVNGNAQIGGQSALGTLFPTSNLERRPTGNVSANYVTGGHTFKLGAEYRKETFPSSVRTGLFSNTTGAYTFGTAETTTPSLQGVTTNQGFAGYEFASFLMGGVSFDALRANTALAVIKSQWGLYLQDTWKVTRKLTFDYGVRWDYGTYEREQYGRNASIGLLIPNPSASGRLGAAQYEAGCNCNFATNYPYAIGPRLGIAYQIDKKTVLRAGWGVVYNATSTATGSSGGAEATTTTFPTNSGLITGLFKDGLPSNVVARWPTLDPAAGQAVGGVVAMSSVALLDPNAGRPARLMQFNIGLQREIHRNLVVEASYVGNRGVWWTASALAPLNSLSEGTLRAYGFNDFTSSTEAALLTTSVASLTATQKSTLAARGITGIPYANFPTTQTVRQSLFAYPQYTGNGLTGSPLGKTWYDSFQLNVTQRLSHGVSFNMNYTFSKSLDLMSSPDVFNRDLGKNLGAFDVPHTLRFTAQYDVGNIHSSAPLLKNKLVAYTLSGWGLGWYSTYQSAGLVGRPTSNGSTPISNFLGRGPGSAQLKQNADGTYMNPWSVDWFDYDGNHHTDPLDVNCHCFDPTKTVALNPLAWDNIPNGQWGAQQGSLRFFRGIRLPVENANISRNFRIKERMSLNIRVEFNNIFNRTQLPGPQTVAGLGQAAINFAAQPTKFTSGANAGLYSGGFGTFSVVSGLVNQRTGTFVARFQF